MQPKVVQHRDEFTRTGVTVVPGFLDRGIAERIQRFLVSEMPPDWWFASVFPGPGEQRHDIRNLPMLAGQIADGYARAQARLSTGAFSYAFMRTLPHLASCACPLCETIAILEAPPTMTSIAELTGLEITASGGLFASDYLPASFLSPHTDQDNGRVALVWQLTSGWLPQYGGLLHLLDDTWQNVRRVVVPAFNEAVLFAVPAPNGTPHFVSHVPPGVPARRVAISGWYAT